MTPEQFEIFLVSNEKATGDAVQKFVNGKIDAMRKELEENHSFLLKHSEEDKKFQERMEPYFTGLAGLKIFRDLAVWVAGGLVAWTAIKGFFIK